MVDGDRPRLHSWPAISSINMSPEGVAGGWPHTAFCRDLPTSPLDASVSNKSPPFSIRHRGDVTHCGEGAQLTVEVIGHQFQWR